MSKRIQESEVYTHHVYYKQKTNLADHTATCLVLSMLNSHHIKQTSG